MASFTCSKNDGCLRGIKGKPDSEICQCVTETKKEKNSKKKK